MYRTHGYHPLPFARSSVSLGSACDAKDRERDAAYNAAVQARSPVIARVAEAVRRRSTLAYANGKLTGLVMRALVVPPPDAYRVPGYLHPTEGRFLYWLATRVRPGGVALEIGSFTGKSSTFLAAGLVEGARLACVDTWWNDAMLPYNQPANVFEQFLANTSPYRDKIETHRGTSLAIASEWQRPIDVLFIDGDHSFEGCSADLKAWLPFVRRGGWVALHDTGAAGVERAIAEHFPRAMRSVAIHAWSIFAARKR